MIIIFKSRTRGMEKLLKKKNKNIRWGGEINEKKKTQTGRRFLCPSTVPVDIWV